MPDNLHFEAFVLGCFFGAVIALGHLSLLLLFFRREDRIPAHPAPRDHEEAPCVDSFASRPTA